MNSDVIIRYTLFPFMMIMYGSCITSIQTAGDGPFFVDVAQIQKIHSLGQDGNTANASALKKYLHEADSFLLLPPVSVMEKKQIPPSGDKHDFLSMGPYWWPDSSKHDGLPYIRRDGRRNPEYHSITDQEYFNIMVRSVEKLAIAYALTGNEPYAAKASEFLRVWFLDAETRMNPNLNHGQFIPGINTGRGIGIIETRFIFKVLDALCLLERSNAWAKNDDIAMRAWLKEYLHWLTNHQYGIDESGEKNNHGTWYDVQTVSIALFLGETTTADNILREAQTKRSDVQIGSDGKQPLELSRTRSWSYSTMNLTGLFHLAALAERRGIDLWKYRNVNGASLKSALDYLLPFSLNTSDWKYQQIGPFEIEPLIPLLKQAMKHYGPDPNSGWIVKLRPGPAETTVEEMVGVY
jgi:hypothetical protein